MLMRVKVIENQSLFNVCAQGIPRDEVNSPQHGAKDGLESNSNCSLTFHRADMLLP